jgi:hypothetical protein
MDVCDAVVSAAAIEGAAKSGNVGVLCVLLQSHVIATHAARENTICSPTSSGSVASSGTSSGSVASSGTSSGSVASSVTSSRAQLQAGAGGPRPIPISRPSTGLFQGSDEVREPEAAEFEFEQALENAMLCAARRGRVDVMELVLASQKQRRSR